MIIINSLATPNYLLQFQHLHNFLIIILFVKVTQLVATINDIHDLYM